MIDTKAVAMEMAEKVVAEISMDDIYDVLSDRAMLDEREAEILADQVAGYLDSALIEMRDN